MKERAKDHKTKIIAQVAGIEVDIYGVRGDNKF